MDALFQKLEITPPFHVTTINDLPNVIMEDIFIQLPTKLCFQCMCVSKLWQKLLCAANFAHRFLCYPITEKNSHHKIERDDLFLLEGNMPLFQVNRKCLEDFKTLPFPLKFQLHLRKSIKIVASCGDLFLCRETEHDDDNNKKNNQSSRFSYYIGNPISQRWVKLPPLHGSWKNHLVGFVFDEKRLVIVHLSIDKNSQATVWKLSSDTEESWFSFPMSYPDTLKKAEFSSYILSHNHHLVSLNGRLYLAAQKGVLEFNPISDSWSFIAYGFKVVSHYDSFRIGSCEGVLCLSQMNASYKYSYFRVWDLKEDSNNKRVWYLKTNVKFDRISSSNNGESCWRTVLNFHLSFGEKLYLRWNSFTALCNLSNNTVQLLAKDKLNFSISLLSTWVPTRYRYSYRTRPRQTWYEKI